MHLTNQEENTYVSHESRENTYASHESRENTFASHESRENTFCISRINSPSPVIAFDASAGGMRSG